MPCKLAGPTWCTLGDQSDVTLHQVKLLKPLVSGRALGKLTPPQMCWVGGVYPNPRAPQLLLFNGIPTPNMIT